MLNFRRKRQNRDRGQRRRQVGPVIVAVLFLFAACGISLNFFAGQILNSTDLVSGWDDGAAVGVSVAESDIAKPSETDETTEDTSDAGDTGGDLGDAHERSELPPSDVLSSSTERPPRSADRLPTSEETAEVAGAIRDRPAAAVADINLEAKEEDYKISLEPNKWKGNAQLLPSPMFVRQLGGKNRIEIRGGGWMAIDLAKSQIIPVELYKGKDGTKPVIEARRLDGTEIVTPSNTGFPIVRGISDLRVGKFEVFENPPCLVRFGGVTEDEVCELTLRGSKIRYRFEAPVLVPDAPRPDNVLSNVSIDTGLGGWLRVGSFNENFYPIGDANRDGYPDFFAESVTSADESGVQALFISHLRGDTVEYLTYSVPFKSAR